MWTADQAQEIQTIAKETKPGLVTYAIPHGLKVNSGENAIVEHLKSTVPPLLKTHFPAA
jgi:hypothetical protein